MARSLRRATITDWLLAIAVILGANILGSLPAFFVGSDTDWIDKPWFYPPEILFPIVWTLLFSLIGLGLFLIWRQGIRRRDVQIATLAFVIQFAINIAWTPVFFGLQRPDLGLIVIAVLWVAIVATIVAFERVNRFAAILLVPYLAWVSFAIVLNYAIYAAA